MSLRRRSPKQSPSPRGDCFVGLGLDTRPAASSQRHLSIQLAHHNVNDTKQGDEIRNLFSDTNSLERSNVDERGSAHMIAPGIWLAVRDYVKAQLAFRGFNTTIRFPCRNPNLIDRFLRIDRALRDLLNGLLQNSQGLPNLIQTNQIVIVQISVRAHGHIKLKAIIDAVGVSTADIIR